MGNTMQIFEHPKFGKIPVIQIDGEPYFKATEVANALGYSNPQKAVRDHVDAEDKRTEQIVHPLGGKQNTVVINESGLYSLILSSKLPQAKEFKHWVTAEVLPAIRKQGYYVLEKKSVEVYKRLAGDPEFLIQMGLAIKAEKEKVAQLTQENVALNHQVEELTPKAQYCDDVLNSRELLTISEIAKEFGLNAVKLNKLLNAWGVQYKVNGTWLLYDKYANFGWTKLKTTVFYHKTTGQKDSATLTYWTQAGRQAIHNLLKSHGFSRVSQPEVTTLVFNGGL